MYIGGEEVEPFLDVGRGELGRRGAVFATDFLAAKVVVLGADTLRRRAVVFTTDFLVERDALVRISIFHI